MDEPRRYTYEPMQGGGFLVRDRAKGEIFCRVPIGDVTSEEQAEARVQDIIKRLGVLAHDKGGNLVADPKCGFSIKWF